MVQEAKMDIFMCSICSLLSIIRAVGFCLSITVDFLGQGEVAGSHSPLQLLVYHPSKKPLEFLWR